MRQLVFVKDDYYHDNYRSADIQFIVELAKEKGYILSESDAQLAWQEYSDSMCDSWMRVDRDSPNLVWMCIRCYLNEKE